MTSRQSIRSRAPPGRGRELRDHAPDVPAQGQRPHVAEAGGVCGFCTSQNTQRMDVKENVYCITKRTSQAFI